MNKKAFTLVELIIVIAIIAVLASLAFMALSGETSNARDSARKSDLSVIENSINVANSKNRSVKYDKTVYSVNTNITTDVDTDADDVADFTLAEGDVQVRGVRGAVIRKLTTEDPLVDSSILQNMTRDPKGVEYIAAFLNDTYYQIYAVLENPETKVPTTLIKGSFKEGIALTKLVEDVPANTDTTITVSNAKNFLIGDKIRLDGETALYTITGITSSSTGDVITVSSTILASHQKNSSVVLAAMVQPVANVHGGAESLACLVYNDGTTNKSGLNTTYVDTKKAGLYEAVAGVDDYDVYCPKDSFGMAGEPVAGSIKEGSKVVPYWVQ